MNYSSMKLHGLYPTASGTVYYSIISIYLLGYEMHTFGDSDKQFNIVIKTLGIKSTKQNHL